ncbi:AAA family ATPase [Agarivorans sp. B2Z047]|uniref:PhoH family protein n=1 Tax=Agarivorans sp. B2Z047 TaxID=2652721 RepID=UPI00128CC1EB|nr:PhoH family protein [Agarivorans sp. B2Z047]MPW31960.1 AAA family ATPase [Agarivorans sp. B2Z047]UQN41977.1 PhoH family protein [Agarivorans sp. B2Z047]
MSSLQQDDNSKIYVLDTNVLLHDPLAVYAFEEHRIVVPMTVLEELDNIKDRKKDVSRDARLAIHALEKLINGASPELVQEGVEIEHEGSGTIGTLSIFADYQLLKDTSGSEWMPMDGPDNVIINSALFLQRQYTPHEVVLVTKDINMRLKAKGAGLNHVEDYRRDKVVEDIALLAKGFIELEGSFWGRVQDCKSTTEGRDTIHTIDASILRQSYVNQYVIDDTESFAGRVIATHEESTDLLDIGFERLMAKHAWGVHPKNIYQGMALDSLLDPDIDLVVLSGPAGSGKTFLALAAALEMTIEKGLFGKIIVTRSTPEIAESIGFLPGTEEEKMLPWLGAVTDTLEVLHKNDVSPQNSMQYIVDKANLQFKSLNFMRGRSITGAFVLVDEAQNLTASQLKTLITRCGEGTKLVISGNLAQIDSNYLSPVTSGLAYIIERFKEFDGSANVYLDGVVRSRLASFAENNL